VNWLRVLCLCCCLITSPIMLARPIVLTTDIFPPYQVQEDDLLRGSSVEALECIFNAMQQPFEIRVMPWERAIHEVSQTRSDGFFSASKMRRASDFAVLSAPLALEKWYWYSNSDVRPRRNSTDQEQGLRIGAVRGSNQVAWLQENGYRIEQQISSTEQLLKLLQRGRIDAFLADQRTLRTELTRLPLGLRPAHEHFQQYANLGVYFSSRLIAEEPDFLGRFNREIFHCLPERHTLTAEEQQRLLSLHEQLFTDWLLQPELIAAVIAQNRAHQNMSIPQVLAQDRQWLEENRSNNRVLINSVLAHPLSVSLKEQQNASAGLITEIMVTDSLGLNVAISEVTTDYWQGDELKFSDAFFNKNSRTVIGPLDYDQSAQSYQVHISSQIRNPENGEVIGVLILGLDIQQALKIPEDY